MAMFLVVLRQSGPEFDRSRPLDEQSRWSEHAAFMDGLVDDGFLVLGGPLAGEGRVAHAVPWSETHLRVDSIEPWTIRLDARRN